MDSPIFVVGAPRSGTTLLRLVLNSHPRIAIPNETEYFPAIYEPYSRRPAGWRQAIELFVKRCEHRFLPQVDLTETREELLALPAPDWARLLALPLAAWGALERKPRWGEKTPFHIFHADAIMRLFPDARVVVMLRDPRATVASMNRFGAIGSGTSLNACLWRDSYSTGLGAVERAVPHGQRLIVRYEALIGAPERVIEEVCNFVGEAFDRSLLDFHQTTATYSRLPDTPKTAQPIHGAPDAWRDELSESDVAIVETICRSQIKKLGYERNGRRVRPRERAVIAANIGYFTLKQWQNRRERYHPVLYEPLTRLRTWRRRHFHRRQLSP
jgi:hypothetical protein